MSLITEAKGWDQMSDGAKTLILHSEKNDKMGKHRQSILSTLSGQREKGQYNTDDAMGLWKHHADRTAMSCCDEAGHAEPWNKTFSKGARSEAAKYMEDFHKASLGKKHLQEAVELNPDEIDLEKATMFSMLDDVLHKNIIDFKSKFNEIILNRLSEAVENVKRNLTDHVFNGKTDEVVIEKYMKDDDHEDRRKDKKNTQDRKAKRKAKTATQGE